MSISSVHLRWWRNALFRLHRFHSCRDNKACSEEGWAASSVQMGIWSSGCTHMYACEKQIEERERGLCEREIGERRKEGKMQFQITCACAAAWVGMCWRERERWLRIERGDDGDSARQYECVNWCIWHKVGSSSGDASKLKLKTKRWYREALLLKLREWWYNRVFDCIFYFCTSPSNHNGHHFEWFIIFQLYVCLRKKERWGSYRNGKKMKGLSG